MFTTTSDLMKHSVTEDDAQSYSGAGVMHFLVPSGWGQTYYGLLPPDPPPFWSIQRDIILRSTVFQEGLWADAVAIAASKVASKSFDVKSTVAGNKVKLERARRMMVTLDANHGYVPGIMKGVRDYLTQDNGEWWEIVRVSNASGSRIIGLVHLDSRRCQRTGDPDVPVLYMDLKGRYHELKDYQVINLTDMPSPAAEWYGVGQCAASRAYNAIYKMAGIERYLGEKITGNSPLEIHLVSPISEKSLTNALATADQKMTQKGATHYKGAVVVPMLAGDRAVSGYKIQLAGLPENFNRKEEFDLAVVIYADAIGLDPQDIQALGHQGLGTGTQSKVLDDKAKGKGLAARDKQWAHEIDEKVFPDQVTFVFNERDLNDEMKKAEISMSRAAQRAARIASQEITNLEARQLAVEDNDLPKEMAMTEDIGGESLGDEEKPVDEGEVQAAQNKVENEQAVTSPVQQAVPQPVTKSISEVLQLAHNTIALKESLDAMRKQLKRDE